MIRRVLRACAFLTVIFVGLGIVGWVANFETKNSPSQTQPQPKPAQTYEDASAAANRGDYATALRIIRPLAEQGNAKAQSFLGTMYEEGWGLPHDHAEATKWFGRAADQGDWNAQVRFAVMYRDGAGVPRDYIRAYMWFDLAAQSTEPAGAPAQYTPAQTAAIFRDDVAQSMTPVQIAEAKKLVSEWKRKQ